jgi:hypothetical protein
MSQGNDCQGNGAEALSQKIIPLTFIPLTKVFWFSSRFSIVAPQRESFFTFTGHVVPG